MYSTENGLMAGIIFAILFLVAFGIGAFGISKKNHNLFLPAFIAEILFVIFYFSLAILLLVALIAWPFSQVVQLILGLFTTTYLVFGALTIYYCVVFFRMYKVLREDYRMRKGLPSSI
ncbi:hypothetical protein HMI55_004260 [Coelomomyces lativittatus]|nr:hypothetical protein HMI56_007337 [Coelomomyces lativittatus]KAJ1517984.1 hypothetical protein HMI55_004260 [Coelomomyces lativittatus]